MKHYIKDYTDTISKTISGIDAAEFKKTVDILINAYRKDQQVFIAGNGGSAGTANHFVCDFGKNAVKEAGKRRFRIISLSDNPEKITAFGNDVAFDEIFSQQLDNLMRKGDVLILVSSSGTSADLIKACEMAQKREGKIIALSGFGGGDIKDYADACLIVPLSSYEQIEDIHLMLLHMIVYFFKSHPEQLVLE